MLDFAVFIYALVAMFVLASVHRNRRNQRPDAPILTFVGLGLMSASFTIAVLLAGVAVWTVLHA